MRNFYLCGKPAPAELIALLITRLLYWKNCCLARLLLLFTKITVPLLFGKDGYLGCIIIQRRQFFLGGSFCISFARAGDMGTLSIGGYGRTHTCGGIFTIVGSVKGYCLEAIRFSSIGNILKFKCRLVVAGRSYGIALIAECLYITCGQLINITAWHILFVLHSYAQRTRTIATHILHMRSSVLGICTVPA